MDIDLDEKEIWAPKPDAKLAVTLSDIGIRFGDLNPTKSLRRMILPLGVTVNVSDERFVVYSGPFRIAEFVIHKMCKGTPYGYWSA